MRKACLLFVCICSMLRIHADAAQQTDLTLDERPAAELEWGYHPESGSRTAVNPPAFSWRPLKGITSWQIEVAGGDSFTPEKAAYAVQNVKYNVHCPARTFAPGTYTWHYRGQDAKGRATNWSRTRTFTIPENAVAMPMPTRDELLGRIPKTHPRLFVRPEQISQLRELSKGPLKAQYDSLVRECERLVANPPPTAEPPKYPEGCERGSEEWRKIWWGNREYTIRTLNGAATLGFTRLVSGNDDYGRLAKRILLECAAWDPKGATGYRYNDEAGMPYNYYFARTYTFINDLLTDEERDICRRVMKIRGDEMYNHLHPRHLWDPYASHSNRAWHKLGEVGIAFLGEVEGADEWVWFATNVFYNVYPVWCDDDGGWHEGTSYWASYLSRFSWWADVMRVAMNINAYDKPYFSKVGYYAMYIMPPHMADGGFGDLVENRQASSNVPLVSTFAAQAGNPHWQWYVEQMGGPRNADGYIGFIRGALPKVKSRPPTDLPPSRLFRGIGQAVLNTDITDGNKDVQVVFKSSPFGSWSHGYESNNSFLLTAWNKRLLIRTGRRDMYGSKHHTGWMWSTRSVNNITVNGTGQLRRSGANRGEIVAFKTTPSIDLVVGEAGDNYRRDEKANGDRLLDRYTRAIIFAKPDLMIVYDRLVAKEPSTFEYWLHAISEFAIDGQHAVRVTNDNVHCDIDFLAPAGLTFRQTDQYDPNPVPRIKVREWHLTATPPTPQKSIEFVTIYRPYKEGARKPLQAKLEPIRGGYALTAETSDGQIVALLPADDTAQLSAHGLKTTGAILVQRQSQSGSILETVRATPEK